MTKNVISRIVSYAHFATILEASIQVMALEPPPGKVG